MKKFIILLVVTFCAIASYGQIPYKIQNKYVMQVWSGDYNRTEVWPDSIVMFGTECLWLAYDSVYHNRFINVDTTADTNLVWAHGESGLLDTIPLATLAAIIGGTTASKWDITGTTLHQLDTTKNVAIGTNNALGEQLYVDGNLENKNGTRYIINDSLGGLPFTGAYKEEGIGYLFSGIFPYGGTQNRVVQGYYAAADDLQLFYADSSTVNIYSIAPSLADTVFAGIHAMRENTETDLHLNTIYGLELSYKKFSGVNVIRNRQIQIDSLGLRVNFKNIGGATFVPFSIDTTGVVSFLNYTFPIADGAANEVLTTDGSGVVSWAAANDPEVLFGTGVDSTLCDSLIKFPIGYTSEGFTIDSIFIICTGDSVNVKPKIFYGADISAGGTAVVTAPAAVTSVSAVTKISTFNNASPGAKTMLWLMFSTVTVRPRNCMIQILGH